MSNDSSLLTESTKQPLVFELGYVAVNPAHDRERRDWHPAFLDHLRQITVRDPILSSNREHRPE